MELDKDEYLLNNFLSFEKISQICLFLVKFYIFYIYLTTGSRQLCEDVEWSRIPRHMEWYCV